MSANGNFPSLSQYKPKPKPQAVPPIILQLDNGKQLTASPNVWLAAIISALDPTMKQKVIDRVSNMMDQVNSKTRIVPARNLGGIG